MKRFFCVLIASAVILNIDYLLNYFFGLPPLSFTVGFCLVQLMDLRYRANVKSKEGKLKVDLRYSTYRANAKKRWEI
jgi:hypothetical protein